MAGIENGKFLMIGMPMSFEKKELEKKNTHEQVLQNYLHDLF